MKFAQEVNQDWGSNLHFYLFPSQNGKAANKTINGGMDGRNTTTEDHLALPELSEAAIFVVLS